ncbi:MAG: peptide chain release factor N(5)-glutamine methyltransferase, partial [Bacteroidaceae bacterium]|nr:peptide chain release factor N(5)-glutamine methyltransferase [Bacteroidaceae bacterium]
MTVDEARRVMLEALGRKFGEGEARSLTGIIFEELMHYSAVDVLLRGGHDLPEVIDGELPKVLGRLLANEPVQYVFGVAEFHGHRFKVTPATLIPRPETAELVDMIVDEHKEAADLRVLDIGTGSGCIAVSLARALKYAEVYALDISEAALEVAAENARELKTRVKFFKSDVLKSSQLPVDELDIIVSNPP